MITKINSEQLLIDYLEKTNNYYNFKYSEFFDKKIKQNPNISLKELEHSYFSEQVKLIEKLELNNYNLSNNQNFIDLYDILNYNINYSSKNFLFLNEFSEIEESIGLKFIKDGYFNNWDISINNEYEIIFNYKNKKIVNLNYCNFKEIFSNIFNELKIFPYDQNDLENLMNCEENTINLFERKLNDI